MINEQHRTTPPRPMESIKLDNLLINFTTEFQQIWNSTGSRSNPAAFWHPTPAPDLMPGFFPVGDVAVPGFEDINGSKVVAVVREADFPSEDPARGKALSRPNDYIQVWKDTGSGAKQNCTVWRPVPPDGYVALGLTCTSGEKPSVHAIRCVRADLVIESYVGDEIWSEGRGGVNNFSAWGIQLPSAEAGEIYIAPGHFVSDGSGQKPWGNVTHALRMKIPLQTNAAPQAPVISDFKSPVPSSTSQATQVAMIPWFAVSDHPLSAVEALSKPMFYRLERKDQYTLVGHGHNTEDESKLFKWTVPETDTLANVRTFHSITAVSFDTEWRADIADDYDPIQFAAHLGKAFTRSENVSNGWATTNTLVVAAIVPKNQTLAVYQLESRYDLLNENGRRVAGSVPYTDSEGLHWVEHSQEKNNEAFDRIEKAEGSPAVTNTAP